MTDGKTDTKRNRNSPLDELRAAAIVMVLVYHVGQRWPPLRPHLESVTKFGEYGVDLFFVLSGWLIGKLYWGEFLRTGTVRIDRFIIARLSRTIISHLAALCVAYAGVAYFRHEHFNWGYFLFVQNYYIDVPYFSVSWSLCVEEHFYLLLPFPLRILRCQ